VVGSNAVALALIIATSSAFRSSRTIARPRVADEVARGGAVQSRWTASGFGGQALQQVLRDGENIIRPVRAAVAQATAIRPGGRRGLRGSGQRALSALRSRLVTPMTRALNRVGAPHESPNLSGLDGAQQLGLPAGLSSASSSSISVPPSASLKLAWIRCERPGECPALRNQIVHLRLARPEWGGTVERGPMTCPSVCSAGG